MHGRLRGRSAAGLTLACTMVVGVAGWAGDASATAATANRPRAAAVRPLAITPTSLPNAIGAVSYSKKLTASGGAGGPYTFGLDPASRRLPPGLQLKSTGNLTGTPTQVGTFPFTARVTDKAGNVRSAAYSVSVSPGVSLIISGYVGHQCRISGRFASGSMTVSPFGFGRVTGLKGTVQVPGKNGPSLVKFTLNSVGSRSLGLGWLTVVNTTDAQCSAVNPIFSLSRPTRLGLAAASGTGWFLATVDGINYALSVQFTVVTRY